MIQNNLTDQDISQIFHNLTMNDFGGLSSICIIMNDIGKITLE